ncbi:MAG: hypothetical protein ACI4Q4_02185 [Oscillospiraceae bacterium]
MKNKRIAAILAATMLATVFAGCRNSSVSIADDTQSTKADTEKTTKAENPVNEESLVTSITENSSYSDVSAVPDEEDSTTEESTAADSNSDNDAEAATADVFCFEFSIDDETYRFPFKYTDMEQNGWKYKKDGEQDTIKANQYLIGLRVEKDDLSMNVQPINFTDSEITAKDANIGQVALDSYYIKPESHKVKYGALILGTSTMEDVLAAYGEPSYRYESETHPTVTYKMETYVNVKFCFDSTKGGILEKIELQNFNEN